jgi:hypothetical protein
MDQTVVEHKMIIKQSTITELQLPTTEIHQNTDYFNNQPDAQMMHYSSETFQISLLLSYE